MIGRGFILIFFFWFWVCKEGATRNSKEEEGEASLFLSEVFQHFSLSPFLCVFYFSCVSVLFLFLMLLVFFLLFLSFFLFLVFSICS